MMTSEKDRSTKVAMEFETSDSENFVIGSIGRFDDEHEEEFVLQDFSFKKHEVMKRKKMLIKYSAYTALGLFLILIPLWLFIKNGSGQTSSMQPQSNSKSLIVCPKKSELKPPKTADYLEYYENLNKEYTDVSKFRDWVYVDGIDNGYQNRKLHLSNWKIAQFANVLKSGDSIYESASGLGTNLALTLELLSELKGINNLKVYGNDMIESSVARSKELFTVNNIAGSSIGEICVADSTHLFHVPSNTFHLAYSGYVDPLDNPLGFESSNYETKYDELCELASQESSWEVLELARLAQEIQDEWFSLWVSELIRITKPGGTIVVEDVAHEYCKDRADWGGVSKLWWLEASAKYDWGVFPNGIHIEDSAEAANNTRYHVVMKKMEEES